MTFKYVGRGALLALLILIGILWLTGVGLNDMGFFSSDKQDLRRLLGDPGTALVEGAEVATWQPDPDHKPSTYYALRSMDESNMRKLAKSLGMTVAPIPALEEAIWKLPPEVRLPGWAAAAVAPGDGLQGQATFGSANAWMRWHGGQLFVVVLRAN